MMRWIIESSLKLRFLIIVVAAVLIAFGINELRKMPVDVFPEFNPPLVEIQTEALGLSAAEVESLITVPMEADLLNGVAWLDQLYSESVSGLSSILLVFEPGTDLIKARQMVQERLTQAFALPNVSKPPTMLQPLSASNRVMMVGLSSKDLSLIDMSVLARWNIKPRLMGVPGVANVAIWGQREQQLQVQVDPKVLHEAGVELDQVIETAGEALWVSPLSYLEASTPGTAGWIDTPNQRLTIRHLLPIRSPPDLAKVAIAGTEGKVLGDVAKVVQDHQPLIGDAILNNGPGLLLVIEKFPNAHTLEVTKGVEEALDAMRPGLTGIEIDSTVFRPANYIELALANLARTLLIGAILAILILLAFFFNWRLALISSVTIGVSLIMAAFVLYLRGATTINVMVLAGFMLALGVIIDDAIIDVDNIARRLRQHRRAGGESTLTIILASVIEMRSAVVFATLIILLAVMPIFFMQGLTGAFFQPLTHSYTLALLISLLVALIVTPALSLLLLDRTTLSGRESPPVRALQAIYNAILKRTVHAPYVAIGAAIVIVVIGFATLPLLRQSLLPSLQQTDLLIQWEGPPGTSRPEMNRITTQVTTELRAIPGVRNVGSHVGRAITGDQVVGINAGEIWVSLNPAADYEVTVAAIKEVVDGYPGLFREVQTYQPERTGEALIGANKDIVVRIYGHDLDVLRTKVQEVDKLLAQIRRIKDVQAEALVEEPQVEIEVDLAKAEKHQVKPGDVRRTASSLISGIQVGNLYEDQKIFDVVVWGVPEIRNSLTNIRNLLIDTPAGQAPLGELADVRIAPAPTTIKRDSVSRYMDVGANVSGRSVAAVAADIKSRLKEIQFPMEHHAEVLGASAAQQAAQQRLWALVVAAVIGIFLLFHAASGSWRMAFFTFLTMPMALTGGVLAVLAESSVLTIGSLFGFLAVLALAVRNALVMIHHCQNLEQAEGESFGPALVLRSAQERVGPILLTVLTTAAVFVPFIFLGNMPGHEIVRPMAVVILGGLVTATLLNLLVVPALYLRFGYNPELVKAHLPVGPAAKLTTT